ncbi:zinc finger, matrin-type 2 [Branchiostoma belcheri]|nr:zinc finger, matrin-type 2 [Branchiostoma belcheri]
MTNTTGTGPTLNVEGTTPGDRKAIANAVNETLSVVTCSLDPLNKTRLPTFLPARPVDKIQPWQVYSKLQHINVRKAAGTDGLSNRVIKHFAYEISTPVTAILNASISEGVVPEQWRMLYHCPKRARRRSTS